jgi:hypothetical protein
VHPIERKFQERIRQQQEEEDVRDDEEENLSL